MYKNNQDQPLISVIVPVYNGKDYIEECIDSIEAQSYFNKEILIIDDGSSDGTDLLCEELKARNPIIRLFRLEDEGVSAARNLGLKEAAGDYITFVDADDRILPNMLEPLLQVLLSTESDMTGCGFWCWSQPEQWKNALRAANTNEGINSGPIKTYSREQYLREEILNGNTRCWSKLYKRSLLEGVQFRTDLTIGEDMLFLIDLLPNLNRAAETQYQDYGYFRNPKGAMYREFQPSYMDQITCWEVARDMMEQYDVSLKEQISAKVMTSIMLTVGKLAIQSEEEQKANSQYVLICHQKLLQEIKNRKTIKHLTKGYRLKVHLFSRNPQLYMRLYQKAKGIRR